MGTWQAGTAASCATVAERRARRVPSFLPAFLLLVLTGLLAGCVTHGNEALVPVAATVPGAERVTIHVATTRSPVEGEPHYFGAGRSDELRYARYVISVPPGHKPPDIEWPQGRPDPRKNFVVVSATQLSEKEFFRSLDDYSKSGDWVGRPDAGIFVHGYNNTQAEALFRVAQLAADATTGGVPILFSWPSQGSAPGYLADRDSAAFSRDALAKFLTQVSQRRGLDEVTVIGHSMGAWLTAEALRTLRLAGKERVFGGLDKVVLASADIDVDVFTKQMEVIGPLRPPLTVLTSPNDRALRISGRIAGNHTRVGEVRVDDPEVQALARRLGIVIIDISSLKSADSMGHDQFITLAGYARSMGDPGGEPLAGDFGRAGAFVLNTVGTTVSTPFVWAANAVSPGM
nr:alpha/beta fold hydrolase [Afifella sp. IM 167]